MKNPIRYLLIVFLFAAPSVFAHTSGASFLSVRIVDPETVQSTLDFDVRDLQQLLQLDRNRDGALTWGEIDAAKTSIEELIFARTKLQASSDCVASERQPLSLADHGEGPFVRVSMSFRCSGAGSALSIDHSAWFEFDPGHRALLEITDATGRITQTLLSQASPAWKIAESTSRRLGRFLVEGSYHLITGYDHLAFLGVLLLALARRPKPAASAPMGSIPLGSMLKRAFMVITAFTIAHSLTLALAATGKLVLPSKPVEVTIAASVFLAAVLNLWRGAGGHGWKLAFAFGLVHGLGFAGALAEMASGAIDLPALAAFNLGIEAAQIAIAVVAVPIFWWLFKSSRNESYGLPVASLSVAALAGFWVVTRLST